jgi:tight adherence protein B
VDELTFAALCFGTAAALAGRSVVRAVDARRVSRLARSQVGLIDVEVMERRASGPTVTLRTVSMVLAASLAGFALIGPVGIAAGMAPAVVTRLVAKRSARQRSERIAEEIGPALRLVVDHLRIGRNLVAALTEVAEETPGPLGDILDEVLSAVRLGDPLEEVFAEVAAREGDRHLGVVASAVGLHTRHGGSLIEILETVVDTVEEEDRLRRDIASITADGRLSAQVLLAMPPVMLLFVSVLSPGYATPLVEHPTGRMMSLFALVVGAAGWRWLRALSSPEVTA